MLAAQNPLTQMDRPHQLFADAPPIQPLMPPAMPPTFMTPIPPMGMQLTIYRRIDYMSVTTSFTCSNNNCWWQHYFSTTNNYTNYY